MPLDSAALPRAVALLRRRDRVLARVISEVGPCRFRAEAGQGAFAALAESIVYQQITGRAAAAIWQRLHETLEVRRVRPEHIQAANEATLRRAGLSPQKVRYLRDLSQQASNGLPLRSLSRLPDERVVEILTRVKGVGRWTAEMFLIFRLGRPDVLPVHDYGIRKALKRAYRLRQLPKPEWIERMGERWRPYRTVACWYLWRSLDAAEGRKR
jgi:3-methyladenine DNA glycosylase/8-oxoguanine DNA glycosylase